MQAVEAGYPYNEDLNGANQEGFGPAQQTIWNGKRESTGQSFIKPIKNRKNLVITTHSVSNKLIFKGNTCVGIEYIKNKKIHLAYAEREVLICGELLIPHNYSTFWYWKRRLYQEMGIRCCF